MTDPKPQVLCVDDEPSILSSLKREFRNAPFDVSTTGCTSEALELVKSNDYAVVISDYRMPGMSGVELLLEIKALQPDCKRILLTGQADMQGIVSAINEGKINKFFVKPWNTQILINSVNECIRELSLERENASLTAALKQSNDALNDLNVDLTSYLHKTISRLDQSEYFDRESGLPNEKFLIKKASEKISSELPDDEKLVVIAIGFDSYEFLLDALQPLERISMFGDIAQKLSDNLGEGDFIARVRDDTLCVIGGLVDPDTHSVNFARALAACASSVASKSTSGAPVPMSAGIAIFGEHSTDLPRLVEYATSAMKRAKSNDESKVAIFDPILQSCAASKLTLHGDLLRALNNNEFLLNYQPRVDAHSGEILGAEALLRWQHPERGLVLPSEFIPALEESGLIVPVGEWVLKSALTMAKRISERGHSILIAVNVSSRQFDDKDFKQTVFRCAAEVNIEPAKYLELELTESAVVSDIETALKTMNSLTESGIRLAIDDFGTGYSSFSYLAAMPASYLKIDQSFIQTLHDSPRSEAIVKTVISAAHALDMRVIAEGVETNSQVETLQKLDCDEIQGFRFYRPLEADDFVDALAKSGQQRAANY